MQSQPGSASLSAGLFTLEETGLALQALSPPLPVNEAGAGTRWARARDRVYVATPAGEIWTWEPGANPVKNEALTELLAAYRREHASLVESLDPPVLFGWDDLLVVLDRPLAMEELRDASGRVVGRTPVNTWYAVAIRDGVILGEIVSRDGTLTGAVQTALGPVSLTEDGTVQVTYPRKTLGRIALHRATSDKEDESAFTRRGPGGSLSIRTRPGVPGPPPLDAADGDLSGAEGQGAGDAHRAFPGCRLGDLHRADQTGFPAASRRPHVCGSIY